MRRPLNFIHVASADFITRSAYQMGKTPVLPIFAAALGASGPFLGFIVSVSTLTGFVLKPLIGILSDHFGRRVCLIVGTLFFVGTPFLYRFIQSPEGLFGIRVVHGLATAITGPVALAFVAEGEQKRVGEKLGWFGLARHSAYIVGPALGGWLMLVADPVNIFTIIGISSSLAFFFILFPSSPSKKRIAVPPTPIRHRILHGLRTGAGVASIWLAGGLEATVFIALYGLRVFLPVYAIAGGVSVALVGAFFAIQETVHVALRPAGGRLGDRVGYLRAISFGLALMGLMLPLIGATTRSLNLMILAPLLGVAQALIFPSTVALVSTRIDRGHLGAGMGLIGMLRNAGKIIGPILGGVLVHWFDFSQMVRFMGFFSLLGAILCYRAKGKREA